MAVKVTLKAGFREIELTPVKESPADDGDWTEATLANGHSLFTSANDGAACSIDWSATETQNHSVMKTGSTVETWIGADGKAHAIIRRKL